jgi:hypothetical protein
MLTLSFKLNLKSSNDLRGSASSPFCDKHHQTPNTKHPNTTDHDNLPKKASLDSETERATEAASSAAEAAAAAQVDGLTIDLMVTALVIG